MQIEESDIIFENKEEYKDYLLCENDNKTYFILFKYKKHNLCLRIHIWLYDDGPTYALDLIKQQHLIRGSNAPYIKSKVKSFRNGDIITKVKLINFIIAALKEYFEHYEKVTQTKLLRKAAVNNITNPLVIINTLLTEHKFETKPHFGYNNILESIFVKELMIPGIGISINDNSNVIISLPNYKSLNFGKLNDPKTVETILKYLTELRTITETFKEYLIS